MAYNLIATLFLDVKTILLVLAIILGTLLLLAVVFFRVRYDHLYFKDLSIRKRVFTHDEMVKSLNNSIRVKNGFHLFEIVLGNYTDMIATYGSKSVLEGVKRLVSRIDSETGKGVRVSAFDQGTVLVYFKEDINTTIISRSLKEICTRRVAVSAKKGISFVCNINIATYPKDGRTLEELFDYLHSAPTKHTVTAVKEDVVVPRLTPQRETNIRTVSNAPLNSETKSKDLDEIVEIKKALANKEFFLMFHPIVESKHLDVLGAECLIRWKHPTRGLLPPSAFLPVLERTGEISSVGNWILEEAAKQMLLWRTQGKSFWLSVNLSAKQLLDSNIITDYKEILRRNNVEAGDFYLEIYDISLYNKEEVFKSNVDKLAAMGFHMSVDKFGRGTASLTDLEQVPLSQIKVDMAFLTHAKENVLYSGIISALNAYVKQNNIMMVADGVETVEDLDWCIMYGLKTMQGFYFSKPIESEHFIADVTKKDWWEKSKNLPAYKDQQ